MDKKERLLWTQRYGQQLGQFRRRHEELTENDDTTRSLTTMAIKLWVLAFKAGAKLDAKAEEIIYNFHISYLKKRNIDINMLEIYSKKSYHPDMVMYRYIRLHQYIKRKERASLNKNILNIEFSCKAYIKIMKTHNKIVRNISGVMEKYKRIKGEIKRDNIVISEQIINNGRLIKFDND